MSEIADSIATLLAIVGRGMACGFGLGWFAAKKVIDE